VCELGGRSGKALVGLLVDLRVFNYFLINEAMHGHGVICDTYGKTEKEEKKATRPQRRNWVLID
jgi:hypothetical protein